MEKDEVKSTNSTSSRKDGRKNPHLKDLQAQQDVSTSGAGDEERSVDGAAAAAPSSSASVDLPSESWGTWTTGLLNQASSSWFSKSLESAKVKSSEMFQYLKQDISEFGESIQEASRDLKDKLKLEDTAKAAAETVGETMTTILGQVSSIFGVEPDDDDETSILVGKDGHHMIISRIEARIHSLAMNENVFLEDPDDLDDYDAWMSKFDLETKSSEMTEWLNNNPHLQLHYSQLVPEKVTHLVFWHRFYYQVHLITIEEENIAVKEALEAKQKPKIEAGRESESPTGSASGNDIVHISEEDQKRILSEYEEEMRRVGPNSSGQHSRRSSEQLSSSSSSFAFVTHDAVTNEVKLE